MRIVSIKSEQAVHAFAKRAAEHFRMHATHYTFADGDPKPGELLGIRWNIFTVLVVRLADDFEPACYPTHQLIGGDLPRLRA